MEEEFPAPPSKDFLGLRKRMPKRCQSGVLQCNQPIKDAHLLFESFSQHSYKLRPVMGRETAQLPQGGLPVGYEWNLTFGTFGKKDGQNLLSVSHDLDDKKRKTFFHLR